MHLSLALYQGTASGVLHPWAKFDGFSRWCPASEGVKKSRLCRPMCGKAQPFRTSGLNTRGFRLGRLPESRRLSLHQAAQPPQPLTAIFS
jgi:hypothetical protein